MTMLDGGAGRSPCAAVAERLTRRVAGEPRSLALHSGSHPDRRRVEDFLESAYALAFEGRIRSHYPTLMSVQDADGRVLAAAGFRFAGDGPLFLERYLDEPVEVGIELRSGAPTDRSKIAEIGNLACGSLGASLLLFVGLARHLDHSGCTHAVATATRQLRRSFARAGFATHRLSRADAARLAGQAVDWGGYYDRDPEVLAGAIGPALPALMRIAPALGGGAAQ